MKSKEALKKKLKARIKGKSFSMNDLSKFMVKRVKSLPTLNIGKVYGKGKTASMVVVDTAHKIENRFIEKMGEKEYLKELKKTMAKIEGR